MKKKNMLQIVSLILCLILAPSMNVFAEEGEDVIGIYNDMDQLRYVDDIDEYLEQLNAGLITPTNTTITTYESTATPFGIVSEPSKSCSNIFGHSWTDWGGWYETSKIHKTSGPCISVIERWRYCTRTYCGASQQETDTVWITSCTH